MSWSCRNVVSYKSFDGLEIPAFLFKPKKPNHAAILHPHGGPSSLYAAEWDILAQYLVAKGYTFIAPNYRGSTGFGLQFEHANYGDWGGGDLQDCLHGARYLGVSSRPRPCAHCHHGRKLRRLPDRLLAVLRS